MHNSFVERGVDTRDGSELVLSYQRYLELGGIINEADYKRALDRIEGGVDVNSRDQIKQAKSIARRAGIELKTGGSAVDPRVVLYVILRSDTRPSGVIYHHDQMTDQRIFAEALRMLQDADALDKLIHAYPGISFEYQRGSGS